MSSSQPAAIQHDELHHSRELGKTMPGGQPCHVVFADQIEELGRGFALAERFHRFHRIRRRWPFQFQAVDDEKRCAFDRGPQHFQSNLSGGRFPLELVGRDRGRDKDDRLEVQLLGRVACEKQMGVMNRVESAAEDADFFQTILFVAMAPWPCLFPAPNMKFMMTL